MQITAIPAFENNYVWLLTAPDNAAAVVVDPGEAAPVLAVLAAQQRQVVGILLTHHHGDHVGGTSALLAQFPDAVVYGPSAPPIDGLTRGVTAGDRLQFVDLSADFAVLSVPGHTATHLAFYGHGVLFCGDTLFAGGCGRVFCGTAAQLHESLQRLAQLPDDTLIYCAHEYTTANLHFALAVEPQNLDLQERMQQTQTLRAAEQPTVPSTLALEKATNPFLRVHEPTVKRAVESQVGQSLADDLAVFTALRAWKNRF